MRFLKAALRPFLTVSRFEVLLLQFPGDFRGGSGPEKPCGIPQHTTKAS